MRRDCVLLDCVVFAADLLRVRAALFACRESALCEAAERGSRFSAASLLRDRLAETTFFLRLWPRLLSRSAALRVFSETRPFFGGPDQLPPVAPWKVLWQWPAWLKLRHVCLHECDEFLRVQIRRPVCWVIYLRACPALTRSRVCFSGIVSSLLSVMPCNKSRDFLRHGN